MRTQNCLESESLIYRIPAPNMATQILQFYEKNRQHIERWEPMREPGFYTEEYHLLLLKAHQKEHLSGRGFRLWFALKGVNELAGCVSYSQIIYEPFLSCYLGYKTDADFCGRGLMTEAIRFSSERLFRDYKMHRIEAAVMPINSASKRVLEKCGFRYEGYSSKYLRIRGNWEDHERYALLAAEQE